MSIHQLNFNGKDRVEMSIERFRLFEPEDGYYLAFSGGKDSVVIKALADMSGVKYDAHYNLTSVDPPELVRFIKEQYPDVIIEIPKYKDNYKNPKLAGKQITMWNLIPEKKMPPTRIVRYCCSELKEHGGEGRFTVTGVRWEESAKRKNRGGLEIETGKSKREMVDPDNPDNEQMARYCPTKGKHILNPIIDWTTDEVWEFIKYYDIPYCKLYDEGYKRLGCIGCPMSTHQEEELKKYPKYRQAYLKAFKRMIENREYKNWKSEDEVMKWWIK